MTNIVTLRKNGLCAVMVNGDGLDEAEMWAAGGLVPDLVLADPPYEFKDLGGGGIFGPEGEKAARKITSDETELGNIVSGYDVEKNVAAWTAAGARNIVIFCSNDQIVKTKQAVQGAGYSAMVHVWYKNNAAPMTNNNWISDIEYIIVGRKLGADGYMNNNVPTKFKSKVKIYPSCRERPFHPTPKPISLLAEYICVLSPEAGLVFDPFGGSGSTAIAAIKNGRNVTICENDQVKAGMFERMVEEIKKVCFDQGSIF